MLFQGVRNASIETAAVAAGAAVTTAAADAYGGEMYLIDL